MKHSNEENIILEKSRELGKLIEENELTQKYANYKEKINNDPESLELLTELVNMGEDLTSKGHQGKIVAADRTAQNQILKERLEQNQILKDFIQIQSEYFDFVKQVLSNIQKFQKN